MFLWEKECIAWKEYPNLPYNKNKSELGTAMSGGGIRAATSALGWLRALQRIDILQDAKYLSVNSGSSWVTLPLYWYIADNLGSVEDFLGKHIEPKDLECTILKQNKYGMQLSLTNANIFGEILKLVGKCSKNIKESDKRSSSIKKCFLQSLALNDKPYGEASGHFKNIKKHPKVKHLPHLIINGTIVHEYEATQKNSETSLVTGFLPIEFTPEYWGIPVNVDTYFGNNKNNTNNINNNNINTNNTSNNINSKNFTRSDSTSLENKPTHGFKPKGEIFMEPRAFGVVQYKFQKCEEKDDKNRK